MRILSIETSCDDTGITIMEAKGVGSFKVLADSLATQDHAQYGGVFPMMAKKEHIKNLPILLEKVLKKTGISRERGLDLIAVTYGPGLEPCLWTGIVFAQELAKKWSASRRSAIPVIPVNHMEGHILSAFGKIKGKFAIPKTKFPVLALLVSGGHTELVLIKAWGKYEIIGKTVDDAAGEAFDKVARMLGLPYPGGPHISKLAQEARAQMKEKLANKARFTRERTLGRSGDDGQRKFLAENFRGEFASESGVVFPRPMLYTKNYNFSFSGLKTAVLYYIRDHKNFSKAEVALEFENAVVDTLVYKTQKAVEQYKIKTVIVAGGVAANKHLNKQMKKGLGKKVKLLVASKELSRDNALMIGIAGYMNYIKNKKKTPKPASIKATGDLSL